MTERIERITAKTDHRSARINLVTAALGVVLAVVSAGSAIATNSLKNDISALNRQVESLEQELGEANARLDVRQEQIIDLRAENADLRRLIPPTVDPEEAPDIRASGTVTLADDGDSIDLNSTLPNFGAGLESFSWDSLRYRNTRLTTPGGIDVLTLEDGSVASYETCAVATGYSEQSSIEPHALEEGNVCLRLESGRYAAVTVQDYDVDKAIVAVTVWE